MNGPDCKLLENEPLLGSAGIVYVNAIVTNNGLLRIFNIWGNRFLFLDPQKRYFFFFEKGEGRFVRGGGRLDISMVVLLKAYVFRLKSTGMKYLF